MSSIRLGPCRARHLPCRLRTCRGRCRPLPGSGCLASTPPRTEPDTLQLAPPKLNSTIEIRSRPDKERWEEELVFDEQRTHQDPRRPTKPTHLRSQTPAGVEQELYALSLGHFVVRALMLEAAQRENLDVDRLSFTGCLQILQARLPECDSTTPQRLDQWYQLLLAELIQERLEPRRNRVNPRAVKRKMSKFAKKRPEHRGRPPLKKTFAETVLIT